MTVSRAKKTVSGAVRVTPFVQRLGAGAGLEGGLGGGELGAAS